MFGIKQQHENKLTYTRIIALGFMGMILFGGFLLSLPIATKSGDATPFLDALFTATSATCVTGLVIYDTYTHWSVFGQLVILVLIQIGGLGFMSIVTMASIFLGRRIGLSERKLLVQSTSIMELGGSVALLKRIVFATIIFETAGAILLATRFCPLFGFKTGIYFAIFHSVSAFCNAGIDILGGFGPFCSLAPFQNDPIIILTITALIIIGGIGFIVWDDIYHKKYHFRSYRLHTKLVIIMTGLLLIGGTILFLIFEYNHTLLGKPFLEKILSSFFMATTPRTAGFSVVDLNKMSNSSSLLTMLLMFIGGSPGSTAGGIKTTTFAALVMATVAASRHLPNVNVFKRRIENSIVRQATSIFSIYLFATLSATMLICAITPFGLKEVLLEVISAAGTVGLSAGITPHLNIVSKITILLLMYGGRVGILSLALVLAEKHQIAPVDRPTEKIILG